LLFFGHSPAIASGLISPNYQTSCISIAYEQSLNGAISTQGEVDCFTFNGEAGQRVTGFLDNQASGQLSLRLSQPDGTSLAFCNFNFGDCQVDNIVLATSGVHRLTVDGNNNATGNYTLALNQITFTPLTLGMGYTDTLIHNADLDYYWVEVQTDEYLTVQLIKNPAWYGSLYLRYGALPTESEYDARSYRVYGNQMLDIPVTQAGTYYIMLRSGNYSPGYGAYTITARTNTTGWPLLTIGQVQEVFSVPGLPTRYQIQVPGGTPNLFVTLQKYNTWHGELKLYNGSQVVASTSGSADQILQLPAPAAGAYLIEVSGSGSGRLAAYTVLPELTLGQWIVGTIYRSWGSAWYQINVPPGQASLFVNVETIGLWSELKVYRNAFGTTPYWSASGSTMNLEIPSPQPGIYYVHLTDSAWIQGDDQRRDHIIRADTAPVEPPACSEPTIANFTPLTGGTAGPVTVSVNGQCLEPGATVCLTRPGNSDICAATVTGQDDRSSLDATFDLSAAAQGEWTLRVTNPNSQFASAPTPFTAESGGEADLWVEIIGRSQIRVGRPALFSVRYGNRGTVDAFAAHLVVVLPTSVTLTPIEPPSLPLSNVPSQPGTGPLQAYDLIVTRIPANSNRIASFQLTSHDILEDFELAAGITLDPIELIPDGGHYAIALPGTLPSTVRSLSDQPNEESLHTDPNLHILESYPAQTGPWEDSYAGYVDLFIVWEIDSQGNRIDVFEETGISLGGSAVGWSFPGVGVTRTDLQWLSSHLYQVGDKAYLVQHMGSWRPWPGWTDSNSTDVLNNFQWLESQNLAFCNPDGSSCVSCIGAVLRTLFGESSWPTQMDRDGDGEFHSWDVLAYLWRSNGIDLGVLIEQISTIPHLPEWMQRMFVDAITSISPEDKYGPSGYDIPGTPATQLKHWIPTDRPLDYRIDFWNKENAPAATVDVIITDTLDSNLDWSTFKFTEIGFLDWRVELEPSQYFNVDVANVQIDLSPYYPGAPTVNLLVNVEGTFDPNTGQIKWQFHALDPATRQPPEEPLAGFLPPITNSGWEIGWVAFSAAPKPGLASGTVISNQSYVKFDLDQFKPAPPAGPFINTLDPTSPTSAVTGPTGTQSCSSFSVMWAGQDNQNGSGLGGFDVYVDDLDDAALAYLWQAGNTNTSAAFSGSPGHRYGFYTRARDNAGNVEAAPTPFKYDVEVTAGEFCPGLQHLWLPLILKTKP
jgi:hypothetical protein